MAYVFIMVLFPFKCKYSFNLNKINFCSGGAQAMALALMMAMRRLGGGAADGEIRLVWVTHDRADSTIIIIFFLIIIFTKEIVCFSLA